MSNILLSGCGITFRGENKPTWTNVLKMAGLNLKDLSGPAISNTLILNSLIMEMYKGTYDNVICQLSNHGKLDIELNENNTVLMQKDPIRNFSFQGYWPSSMSNDSDAKKIFYKYLYSPTLEQQDTILKLLHLQQLCRNTHTKFFVVQGYKINWCPKLLDLVAKLNYNKQFVIYDDYVNHETYAHHDHSNNNTVPCVQYQTVLAKYINDNFLKDKKVDSVLQRLNV